MKSATEKIIMRISLLLSPLFFNHRDTEQAQGAQRTAKNLCALCVLPLCLWACAYLVVKFLVTPE